MDRANKPFVHITIDAVDTVVHDPDNHYDPERFDHYATFTQARDAALSSVEVILNEADYDGDDHRAELERMLTILESSETFEELIRQADYQWFVSHMEPARPHAA